jgi:hypothetical protein
MADLYIPDTNEFHPMEGYQGPIIVRACYNATQDKAFRNGDADKAMAQPWKGAYQYLSKGFDAVAGARAFKSIIAGRKFDVLILDLEEGDGDQSGRQAAWLHEMESTGICLWTYAGLYFAKAHNIAVGNKFWVAAYGQREPTIPHVLWQFADDHSFPGISRPCDGSVFHGSLDDLLKATSGAPAPTPTPPQETEKDMFVVRGDKTPEWWLTDFVTKRWIHNMDEMAVIRFTYVRFGAPLHGETAADNSFGPIVLPVPVPARIISRSA